MLLRAAASSLCFAMVPVAMGQNVVTVGPGSPIGNSVVIQSGSTVNVIDGGTIGLNVDLSNGRLNISGGAVALGATGVNGSTSGFTNTNNVVTVTGGNVGPFFQLFNSTATITGGTMNTFGVFSGSTATIRGGVVTGFPDVFSNGTVNLEGGRVNTIRALAGSRINITGTAFALNGVPVVLTPGVATTLTQRNMTLTATLADGSAFDWFLRSFDPGFPTPDVAVTSATIRLTLLPTACSAADLSPALGTLDINDVLAFADGFAAGAALADLFPTGGGDGTFDINDVLVFAGLFSAGCP